MYHIGSVKEKRLGHQITKLDPQNCKTSYSTVQLWRLKVRKKKKRLSSATACKPCRGPDHALSCSPWFMFAINFTSMDLQHRISIPFINHYIILYKMIQFITWFELYNFLWYKWKLGNNDNPNTMSTRHKWKTNTNNDYMTLLKSPRPSVIHLFQYQSII